MAVDETGITIPRIPEIKVKLENALKARFGNEIKLDPTSVFGSEVSVHTQLQAVIWEDIEGAYISHTLRGAVGIQLDLNLGEIIGRQRLAPIRSFTDLELTGDPETIVPIGTKYRDNAGLIWVQANDAIIESGGTVLTIINNENFGAIPASADTIVTIIDNTTGLETVTNPNPATVGRDAESDPVYRERLYNSARGNSLGVYDALRDSILEVEGVTYSRLVENATDTTDANGLTPHSFMNIVEGGAGQDIADTIWLNKPAGIATNGNRDFEVIDSSGNPHDILFQRAELVDIYVIVSIETLGDWDASYEDQMKEDIVSFANVQFGVGDDIINSLLYSPVNNTPNLSVNEILIGLVDPPTDADDIPMSIIQRGTFDIARIEVEIV